MKFDTVRQAYRFFRSCGFGRVRAFRFARAVIHHGAKVEIV